MGSLELIGGNSTGNSTVRLPIQPAVVGGRYYVEVDIPKHVGSLSDMCWGEGLPPEIECLPHVTWGDYVTLDQKCRYLVLSMLDPGKNEEDALPLGFSINKLNKDSYCHVEQFDLFHLRGRERQVFMSEKLGLAELERQLLQPHTFECALHRLQFLAKAGELRLTEFPVRQLSTYGDIPCDQSEGAPNPAALKRWLKNKGVKTGQWGKGAAKGFDKFVEELRSGEIHELSSEQGKVYLAMRLGFLIVTDPSAKYRLIETGQTFQDGRLSPLRQRLHFGGVIAEKLRTIGGKMEDPVEGARRALQEELGISEAQEIVRCTPFNVVKPCCDYPSPNLYARLRVFPFVVRMRPEDVKPFYEERTSRLYTRFDWIPLERPVEELMREAAKEAA